MEWVRQWLMAVTCGALLAALADGLMPQGAVRQVGRTVCALMLLCVVLRPVLRVRIPPADQLLSGVEEEVARSKTQLQQDSGDMLKRLIERESAAYISDKAAALGAQCEAQVECVPGEDDLWLPYRASIGGTINAEQRRQLTGQIERELGIPPERLVYTGGE